MIVLLFIPNCSGLFPFALGGHINFNSNASPSEGCSAFLWMDFYKISCMIMTLSSRSNLINYVFSCPPNCPLDFFSLRLLFLLETNLKSPVVFDI